MIFRLVLVVCFVGGVESEQMGVVHTMETHPCIPLHSVVMVGVCNTMVAHRCMLLQWAVT